VPALAGLLGCQDLRDFRGHFAGPVAADPALALGVSPTEPASLDIAAADHLTLAAALSLAPGFAATPLDTVRRAAADALGQVRVGTGALQSYYAFVTPSGGAAPALAVVSLLADGRVELRLVRGPDEIYAVYTLTRR
jgi:hypothetical protein